MQRSLFCRFSFAFATALAATFAVKAETYYYVGGADGGEYNTASNWATEDGTVCTVAPTFNDGSTYGNTFVFTNDSDVVFHSGTSNFQTQFRASIVKRGAGKVVFCDRLRLWASSLVLEGGYFCHGYHAQVAGVTCTDGSNKSFDYDAGFSIRAQGADEKTFYLYGKGGSSSSHLSITNVFYSESADAKNTVYFYWYGSAAKSMTFKGAANSVTRFSATMYYQSNFASEAAFIWGPDDASATMEVVGRVYDKRYGAFKVANGTLRFADGAGVTSLSNITVAAGATLEIAEDAASDTFGCPVVIEDGGTLKVSRGKFTPSGGITYNGTAVPDGRYKADDFDWLEGDGALYVGTVAIPDEPATTTATWDGGGADTLLTTAENWDGDVAPNLTDGSLVATFPTGTEATVPAGETVAFKGVSVSAASFTLKGGVGSKVALGSSGVTVTGAAFTNECFTTITRSQAWDVAADCEFAAAAEVAADWPTIDTLSLSGAGKYVLLASNPNLCNVDYYTTVEARANVPLGGHLVTAEQKMADEVVECYGNVFSNKFTVALGNYENNHFNLVRIQGGENVFCGEVRSGQVNGHFWRFGDDNTSGTIDESVSATFKGAYAQALSYNNVNTHFSPYMNGIVNIAETPLSVVRMYVGWPRFYRQILNLNVASNVTTRGIHIMKNSTLNTTVPYALYATGDGQSGVQLNDGATWNLGADQGVNVFAGITNTATVASSVGATLHLRDDRLNTVKETERSSETAGGYTCYTSLTTSKVQTNKVVFAGNVNFSKEGVLDHYMEGASTSTGSISVKKGRMIFTTGSWQNASGVSVSDGGTLELRNGKAFGRDTPVAFTGENTDGMLVIPAGTTVRLSNVTVNGRALSGVHSSGLVTGGGTLAAGKLGLSIIFR